MTMNQKLTPATGSLIERAAEAYDFRAILGRSAATEVEEAVVVAAPVTFSHVGESPDPTTNEPLVEAAPPPSQGNEVARGNEVAPPLSAPRVAPMASPVVASGNTVPIDRAMLRNAGFIVPGAPPSGLSEEFRLVKRQLLLSALGGKGVTAVKRGRLILICSAQPNEGKTYSAVNLALSMASETDIEILLVDADVAKPEILSTLGLPGGPGLMDALADSAIDPESLIIRTDIPNLSVLPTGRQTNNDTELLASDRTARLIDGLIADHPRRIVLFDSAPALAASPASVLALNVGQVLLVVRADQTSESDLRDTLAMLDVGPHVQLMLNGVTYHAANRKFGSYYGFGE
jgi:protein-tyrosine kinase